MIDARMGLKRVEQAIKVAERMRGLVRGQREILDEVLGHEDAAKMERLAQALLEGYADACCALEIEVAERWS